MKSHKKFFVFLLLTSIIYTNILILPAYTWGANPNGSSNVYIRGIKSGKYLDVPNGTVANGKEIQLYSGNSTIAQRWRFIPLESGDYAIQSQLNGNYYLSIQNSNTSNGAKVVIEYFANTSNMPDRARFFLLSHEELGVAQIVSKISLSTASLKCLEGEGGGTTNGTKIVHCSGYSTIDQSINQLWVFENTIVRSLRVNPWDLVNQGYCNIAGSTKYQSLFQDCMVAWNNYMGVQRFRRSNSNVNLRIYDLQNDPLNENAIARTYANGIIEFYTSQMDAMDSNAQKQHTIMHELGHALGLGHNNYSGNIMAQGAYAYKTSLGLDDKASYQNKAALY